jgi:NADPH2:quinone reductase
MRAITIESSGGPEALQLVDIPAPPDVTGTDILVRVRAAGINPIDTKIRQALERFPVQIPAILGCDGAGVVKAVGDRVKEFKPGDEVYFCQPGFHGRQGSYAEYAVVTQNLAALKPASLGFTEAAAVPLVLITAWEALHDRIQIKADDTLLVHAGTGGVGHIAIQLARLAGARICTTVSNNDKAALARSLGAEQTILYKQDDVLAAVMAWTNNQGVDIALDTVGGRTFQDTFPMVKVYGDLVTLLQPETGSDWGVARVRNLRIAMEVMLAPSLLSMPNAMQHQGNILKEGAALFDQQQLAIRVAKTFPLEQAAEAHRHLETEHPPGKVVLTLD